MAKRFEYKDIEEMRDYKLEDVCAFKSKHIVVDKIIEALANKERIICVGPQNSGKSYIMKLILRSAVSYNPEETLDEPLNSEEFRGDKIKYFVMRLNDGEDLVDKIRERTGKHKVNDMLVVHTKFDAEHGRYISKLQELKTECGDLVLNDIVTVNKGRYVSA